MSKPNNDALFPNLPAHRSLDEIQLKGLQEAANPMLIATRDGKIVWANRAFKELTGHRAQDVIGQDTRLLKSGLQSNAFYTDLWATVLSGRKWRGVLVTRRRDGTVYDEEMTITPLCNGRGEITHFLAIKLDVTTSVRQNQHNLLLAQAVENSSELIEHCRSSGPDHFRQFRLPQSYRLRQ